MRQRTTPAARFSNSDFNARSEETLTRNERKALAQERAAKMREVASRLMAATPTISFKRTR